jgi:hypothetical protein
VVLAVKEQPVGVIQTLRVLAVMEVLEEVVVQEVQVLLAFLRHLLLMAVEVLCQLLISISI